MCADPEPQARGSLMLNYRVEDDYGVSEARALFALKPQQFDEFGVRPGGFKPPRPLFEAPDMPLTLPQARTRNGAGQTLRDLSGHPWAGADVVLTLLARDEGGNLLAAELNLLLAPVDVDLARVDCFARACRRRSAQKTTATPASPR